MFVKKRRFFRRLGGQKEFQLTLIWRWEGLGLKTWPRTHSGRQKRAIHFGFGYLTWRIA